MANDISVYLVLSGFPFDPDEITAATGLQPHIIWRRGDRIGPTIRCREDNGWKLSIDVDKSVGLDQQINILLHKVEPAASVLIDLGKKCDMEVACVLRVYEDVPAMNFPRDLVESVARLGASIDIDLYYLVGED